MSIQKNLITLCFATVFTLGLAACGSDATMNGNGDEPDARTVAELFATAQESRDASAAAAKAAEEAVIAATEASGELMPLSVKGDSMTATANAQAVLDMQAATVQAVTDAETALQEAKDALEDATEHAADNASLMAALDAAIKAAEADVKTATEARDGDALEVAVALVTGGADEDEPMSAADHGLSVAMAIGSLLGPTSSTEDLAGAPPAGEEAMNVDVVMMDNHTGKTWAEIVGETSKKRFGTGSVMETREADAASIADMTLTSMAVVGPMGDGMQTMANYKGIDGTAFCQGSKCMVEGVAGDANEGVRKFTGSWYFTPTSPMAYYIRNTDDTAYELETDYAQFGHWLADAAGVLTVNTFAGGGVTETNTDGLALNVNEGPDATALLDRSATYEGTAAGMSVHNEVDGDGAVVPGTLQSGAFTADVTLTAKFGSAPSLGGYINGFKGNNAVDPDWRVTLVDTAFTNNVTTATVGGGVTTASAQDGEWSATGYGETTERPTGFFGGFNAHFTDGDAAGAYATRK